MIWISTFEKLQMHLYYSIWTPFCAYIWLQEYLKRYGYIDVLQKSGLQAVVSPSKALKKLQRQLGLEETGSLDKPTIDAMKQPRCGVPDIRNYQTFDGDLKWDHSEVTYRWEIICTKPSTTTLLSCDEHVVTYCTVAGFWTIHQTWNPLWSMTPLPELSKSGVTLPLWPSSVSLTALLTSWSPLGN